MHPVIRILNLLVLAGLAPWLPPSALSVAALLLLSAGLLSPETGKKMLRGLRRVRWLLISLLVFFFWFTPGELLLPVLGPLSPTLVGIQLAAHRVGVLVVMVWAAAVFIGDLPPRELTAALRRLLAGRLNTPVTVRFAERVGLLLAELPEVETRVRAALRNRETSLPDRAAELFLAVERQADTLDLQPAVQLPPGNVPRLQWLLPILLLASGILLVKFQG